MSRPFVLGLTGSIGMGKSTTAGFFREAGVPVWDADDAVRRLYDKGGAAVPLIADLKPDAIVDGTVDRARLRAWVAGEPRALKAIEAVVHPLVSNDREDFLAGAAAAEEPLVILDIPLLYEKGYEDLMDAVLVVTAPAEIQRERVLSRPGMTEEAFEALLSKQMPDAEKRARADYVLLSVDRDETRSAVLALIDRLRRRLADA